MKHKFSLVIILLYNIILAQNIIAKYDYSYKSPILSEPLFHQAILNYDPSQDAALYIVEPTENAAKSNVGGNGMYMVSHKDNFTYKLYRKGNMAQISDKLQGKIYLFQDQIPAMQWKLSQATKTVNNKTLHKAETNFRGRHYTVWYLNDSSKVAPWKFNGLSGTLVEAYTDDGTAHWKLTDLQESSATAVENPFKDRTDFRPYKDFPELAYGLSPELKAALSANPNNKIIEQPRTLLESKFEWEH